MKSFKQKLILTLLLLSYIPAAAACDFIVKESPIDISSMYSIVETRETPNASIDIDSANDNSSDKSSQKSSDSDSLHEKSSDSSADKTKASSSNNKDDKSASSSNTSSNAASSSTASSRAPSRSATSSGGVSSGTTSSSTTSRSNTSSSAASSSSEIVVTKITLDIYDLTLDVGQSKMPIVTMTPYNAVNKNEVWSSSDEKVATVDKNGRITAVGDGKCVVTVSSEKDSRVDAKVNVTVNGPKKVDSIEVSFAEATIKIGETVMPRVTMLPLDADTLAEKWTSDNEGVATVDQFGNITGHSSGTCKITVSSVSNDKVSKEITITVSDEEKPKEDEQYTDKFFDGILIVNKTYGLSPSYNPGGLTQQCLSAFNNLVEGAAEDGLYIYIESGFRSYEEQSNLYNSYVQRSGKEAADTFSARPGHSEHQTGLTIDCNDASDYFAYTEEAQWLEDHAWEYGFIIRYPKGKESITGYKYEPWHIRYVGKQLAQDLHNSGETLEEHFNITSEYRD